MTDPTPVTGAPAAAPKCVWIPATRDVLAVLSTALFIVAYFAPWTMGMPKGADQYVGQMQGAVIVQWAGIMSWYFGSSKSSAQKDDTIAAMAKGDG